MVWTRDPQYTGPIVIRGRQLDGPATLRFQTDGEGHPSPELAHSSLHVPPYTPENRRLTDGSGWWEEIMTYVVVRAPGCYGVQIDGVGFSTTIVFAGLWSIGTIEESRPQTNSFCVDRIKAS